MAERIRDLNNLKSRLETFISQETKLLEELGAAREAGTLRHFMNWNSTSLHVATVYSYEAKRLIGFIEESREVEGGELMTEEAKFELIAEDVQRRVLNLNMRISSRNTSPSANLDEDAQRAFWIELYQAFNGGY